MAQRARRAAAEAACGQHFCGTWLQRLRNGKRRALRHGSRNTTTLEKRAQIQLCATGGLAQRRKATKHFLWSTLESVCSSFLYSCSVQSRRRRHLQHFFVLYGAPASSPGLPCLGAASPRRSARYGSSPACPVLIQWSLNQLCKSA